MNRFWDKVDRRGPDECWEWVASKRLNGYGQFGWTPTDIRSSHRVAYELSKGPIPTGMLVIHSCDNRACCNPAHLALGDHAQNMVDMVSRGRSTRGTKATNAKLDPAQVRLIRARVAGGAALPIVAAEFGISKALACLVANRKRWGWV